MSELLALPAGERPAAITRHRSYRSPALAELLLEHSRRSWTESPSESEPLAELALAAVDRLAAASPRSARHADLRALAWAYIANARRILSDLRGAEALLARAEALLAEGIGDPLERAMVLTIKSSLRRGQRRFDEALQALEQVAAIHRWARDHHLEGQALIGQATIHACAGDPERAVAVIRRALPLIDPDRDRRLLLAARNNLANCLHEAGRSDEAARLLPAVRRLARQVGGPLDLMRVRWVEGQVAIGIGDTEAGERALVEVRGDFLREGLSYDAALVSLELVALYLEQGRAPEARRLAAEMVPIFTSRNIHREAMAALIALKRATELDAATVGLVREAAALLRRLQGSGPPPPEPPS